VTGSSPILSGFSARDAFGYLTPDPTYAESSTGGHVIFGDGGLDQIDFSLHTPIEISKISVFVSSDGPTSSARSFSSISIFGDTGTGLTLLGTTTPNAIGLGQQTITFTFAPAIYQSFRFEGTNATNGARLVEIDGAVPETSTWIMMIMGFALAGLGLRRRARKVAFA
jgi:hypothetical protein